MPALVGPWSRMGCFLQGGGYIHDHLGEGATCGGLGGWSPGQVREEKQAGLDRNARKEVWAAGGMTAH